MAQHVSVHLDPQIGLDATPARIMREKPGADLFTSPKLRGMRSGPSYRIFGASPDGSMPLPRKFDLAVVEIDQAAWVVLPRPRLGLTSYEPLLGPFDNPAEAWRWIERQPIPSTTKRKSKCALFR